MSMRLESDSIGSLSVPSSAYYGVQTLRGANNFQITLGHLNPAFIMSLAEIKKAAALTNYQAGHLDLTIMEAITSACDEIIGGLLHDQFIVDPIQGGAGTSANMNANEVIANRAIELLGGTKGDYHLVHPNDHVNMAQSTNDVIPTAGKLTVLKLLPKAIHQLQRLDEALLEKAKAFDGIIKMGRTQMQDAVPIRLGQSFHAYSSVVKRDIARLTAIQQEMTIINMGGTAIGTAINADQYYLSHITEQLAKVSGSPLKQAADLIDATQNIDGFVSVSGTIKVCAVSLSKMANDLRLLSSGPRAGFGEINLPAKQNGSSIMPGKVNPVIPEIISQVAYSIIGNDVTITMAAEAGQLELNAFEPVVFYKLFESIQTLSGAIATFVENCIQGITANEERCLELLHKSVGTVTALCPYLGYAKAAEIAKKSLATGTPVIQLALEDGHINPDQLQEILNPFHMTQPGHQNVGNSI